MTPSGLALTLIFTIIAAGSFIGFFAGSRYKMDLEQWTVAARGFGLLLVWLLMAGEIYTTFTFLGASGWAYSRGGPALYILAYLPLGYVIWFFIAPEIWEVGRKHGLQTQADFFRVRYSSEFLAAFVALVGVVFLIPYLQLQLTGLGIIVEISSSGGIGRTPAMLISFVLVAAFVLTSGMRGIAWVSVLKDGLLLFAAVFVGFAIPHIFFGGIGPMFLALVRAKPAHLVMPGATTNLGHKWYVSTVLLTAFGAGGMWPHNFAATFSAKSSDTLRRNAIALPLYSITMPLMLFIGFAAVLILPGLTNGDLSMLMIVRKAFPPWFLGVIGGAGALTAMVPASIQILTAATLFAKNLYRPVFSPRMTDEQVGKLAKAMVIVITSLALFCAIHSFATLVSLLLLGYAGVTQFFPGVVLGLYWKRATMFGVFTGLVTGIALVAFLILSHHDPLMGINAGFIALCANLAVTIATSFLTPCHPNSFDPSDSPLPS